MSSVRELYGDVGRVASGFSLCLARVSQARETEKDREELSRLAEVLEKVSQKDFSATLSEPLLTTIGLHVFLAAVRETSEFPSPGVFEKLAELSEAIQKAIRSERDPETAPRLRKFFEEVHGVAQEFAESETALDPIGDLFGALA